MLTIVLLVLLMACADTLGREQELPRVDLISLLQKKGTIQRGNYLEEATRCFGPRKRFPRLHWVRNYVPWAQEVDSDYQHASPEAVERYKDLKFGVRIIWGVYAHKGMDSSWSLYFKRTKLSSEQYIDFVKD